MMITSRRQFLHRLGGLPGIAASGSFWSNEDGFAAEKQKLHHPAGIESIIFYYCRGGPAQSHTFDPPQRVLDESLHPFSFQPCGQSGLEISEVFPHLQKSADRLCLIRSGYGAKATHNEGGQYIFTGSSSLNASLGAWMLYGMGTANPSLPGYVMLTGRAPGDKWAISDGDIHGGAKSYGAGALPPSLQAQVVRDLDRPIDHLQSFATDPQQRRFLDELDRFNRRFADRYPTVPELAARSESFEAAYRMQTAAPEAFDLEKEVSDQAMRKRYGLDPQPTRSTGTKLLLARRLVERGVRFVLVPSMRVPSLEGGVADWDTHTPSSVRGGIPPLAESCDLPLAGLIEDLRERGLLEKTLVIWGGEMGRGGPGNMNHNGNAFTWWMAGGPVPAGTAYGATDEIGTAAVEKPIHVRDLHATILWMCGLDHRKLKFNGVGLDDSCKVAKELVGIA